MFNGKLSKKDIRHFVMLPLIAQPTSNHDVFSRVTPTLHKRDVMISMVLITQFAFAVETLAFLLCILALYISYGMSPTHSQFAGATMSRIYSSELQPFSRAIVFPTSLHYTFFVGKTVALYLIAVREQILPFLFENFFLMRGVIAVIPLYHFIAVGVVVLFAVFQLTITVIHIVFAEIFTAVTFIRLVIQPLALSAICMQSFAPVSIGTKAGFGSKSPFTAFCALSQRLRFVQHGRLATPSAINHMLIIPQISLKLTGTNL